MGANPTRCWPMFGLIHLYMGFHDCSALLTWWQSSNIVCGPETVCQSLLTGLWVNCVDYLAAGDHLRMSDCGRLVAMAVSRTLV